jgi:hypothetical protein
MAPGGKKKSPRRFRRLEPSGATDQLVLKSRSGLLWRAAHPWEWDLSSRFYTARFFQATEKSSPPQTPGSQPETA